MHVGFVLPGDLDEPTGGYFYDRMLIEFLLENGDRVTTVTIPSANLTTQLVDNVRPRVHRSLRELEVDVLVQDWLCHPSLIGVNQRLSYPTVGLAHLLRSQTAEGLLARRAARTLEGMYLASLDGVVQVSKASKRAVDSFDSSPRGVIVPPGADRFDPSVTESDIRTNALTSPLNLVTLGTVEPRKGHEDVLKALAMLGDIDYSLTIVGRCDVDARYTNRLRERIRGLDLEAEIIGAVPDNEVAELLEEAHVLVLPSRYESFGIAYLEAMGFGTVPIGTTNGGATEAIGEAGIVLSPEEPPTLAGHLRALAEDRERLATLGVRARRQYERSPTWEQTGITLRQYLQDVADETAR